MQVLRPIFTATQKAYGKDRSISLMNLPCRRLLRQPASALQCAPADIVTPAASVLSDIWMPAAQVSVYPVGDELFLIQTQTGAIHRLNTSGALAWQLLQHEPLSAEAISEVLAMHFSMPKATLKADIQ